MANIYVRKSGNDSNDGSTPALAKLTIANAVSSAADNDTIYIGSGLWKEQNITIGANKGLSIYGDPTGENTGDAGEVIWSGVSSSDDKTQAECFGIKTTTQGYKMDIQNIIFENWRTAQGVIVNTVGGPVTVKNCKGFNIWAADVTSVNITYASLLYYYYDIYKYPVLVENVYIDGIYAARTLKSFGTAFAAGVYINNSGNWGSGSIIAKNVKVKNVVALGSTYNPYYSYAEAYGLYLYGGNAITPQCINCEIENVYASGQLSKAIGIYMFFLYNMNIYNCSVNNVFALGTSTSVIYAYGISIGGNSPSNAYNCSVTNILAINPYTTPTIADYYGASGGVTQHNCVNKTNFTITNTPNISKFSPLKGVGHTTFPTTDIDGNPRPAYGNGTACDIGAVESTSDIIQKESTIKDSGDYSVKVSPCNYFKKVFQVPVEATILRTVKVKIRIDGTWGTYLPRVSLSGQGMTLSTATKNATTGSFEELTVSGTPTTTGIALLTIEAHSASTDAAFYIDTITIE